MKRMVLLLSLFLVFGMASAQTLVYGQSGLPVTLDSAVAQDGNSLTVTTQVVENLVAFAPGSTELVPGLATEWSANEDATVWTFELREGVTFQDGTPFDAEAVKFNFDRWNDPAHPYGFRDEGKAYEGFVYVSGGYLGEGSVIQEVNVIDEYTVEFVLTNPVGFFPALVAAIYLGIDSPAAVMEAGADYGTPQVGLVGTGPFEFVEWLDGDRVVLERYENYWGDPAEVERVVIRGIEDPTARLAELKSGSIDVAVNLASDDLQQVESDANLETALAESELNVGYLAMHQGNEPFGNELVRQAVAHAIDKEAIVEAFYAGLGSVAQDFLPPTMWGHADLEGYPYDPERARELLAEAGYPDGFSTELWYMPVSRPYYPSPQSIAETFATFLGDVGIEVQLMTEDWGTYLADYLEGEFPMYMLGWNADYADPDNFLYTFFGPSAPDRLGWNDPETVDLLNQARRAPTQEERAELYAQVLTRVHEQAVSLPIAHNTALNAVRSNIEGFMPSPLGSAVSLATVTKEE